jgi:hypothetical protein
MKNVEPQSRTETGTQERRFWRKQGHPVLPLLGWLIRGSFAYWFQVVLFHFRQGMFEYISDIIPLIRFNMGISLIFCLFFIIIEQIVQLI